MSMEVEQLRSLMKSEMTFVKFSGSQHKPAELRKRADSLLNKISNDAADLRAALTILTKLMIGDEENPEGKLGYLEHDLIDPAKGVTADNCESNCLKCYSEIMYDQLMAIPEFESLYTKLYKGDQ